MFGGVVKVQVLPDHPGWWNTDHVLAMANIAVVLAALAAIYFSQCATRSSLGKADDQLALSRAALQATTQPIVIEALQSSRESTILFDESSEAIDITVPMRNVGNGPAFVRQANFTTGYGNVGDAATSQAAVIPVGEYTLISHRVERGHRFYDRLYRRFPAEFAVAINYDDISRTQRTISIMRIIREAEGEYTLLSVGIYHCDAAWERDLYPFAGTDPHAEDAFMVEGTDGTLEWPAVPVGRAGAELAKIRERKS